MAASPTAPTPAAPTRGSAAASVAQTPGTQPIPVAKAPPRHPAAARNGKSRAVQPAARSAPQGDRSETSSGAGRLIGGLVIATIALLMLGGLAYLFWTNVLADRLASNGKDSAPPVVAQEPTRDAGPIAGKGLPPPPVVTTEDLSQPTAQDGKADKKQGEEPSKDGELDVADVKKPDKPRPVITEPIARKD